MVASNQSGGPPTSTDCKQVRAQFGFSEPVVYDATGQFGQLSTASNFHLIAAGDLTIRWKGNYADLSVVEQELVEALPE